MAGTHTLSDFLATKAFLESRKGQSVSLYASKRLLPSLSQMEGFSREFTDEEGFSRVSSNKVTGQKFLKLQTEFLELTTEAIKVNMNRIVGKEYEEDEVWLVNTDKLRNYKDYFNEANACNLEDKFPVKDRIKKMR